MDLANCALEENTMAINEAKNADPAGVGSSVFLIELLGSDVQKLSKPLSFWPADIDPRVVPARMTAMTRLLTSEGEAIGPPGRVIFLSY